MARFQVINAAQICWLSSLWTGDASHGFLVINDKVFFFFILLQYSLFPIGYTFLLIGKTGFVTEIDMNII